MLGLKLIKFIKKICQDQGLDYNKTLIFLDQQLRAKEDLLRRKLNEIEIPKKIDMTIAYISQFGEREGLKAGYRVMNKRDDFQEEISTLDALNIIQDKKGKLDLF